MALHIVILAAGLGKRMFSSTPKVLHKLAGKPMLVHVIEAAQCLSPTAIHVIYGHGGERIREALAYLKVNWIKQEQQLGTGHAVIQALPHLPPHAQVLILSGDVPLIQASTLQALVKEEAILTLLTASLANPAGLGRIVRNQQDEISAIVEEKDASVAERQITEIYSGICAVTAEALKRWLPKLSNHNAQGEYYLTEIIALARAENQAIGFHRIDDVMQIQGVNNCLQLQQLERLWQRRQAEQLLLAGVMIMDAERIDIRGNLHCAEDVMIDINCLFIGNVSIGRQSQIGANCMLQNVTIGNHCTILPNSILVDCTIGDACEIGPFARLRPGTQLANHCKIGNFVETKNAILAANSKANHLSYLGDVTIGEQVNIGAGTITCNYDGAHKHQTIIEDDVFIGSGTQLVAPLKIGAKATIGAGSTIRKNVPADELTLSEKKQKTISGWQRPKKRPPAEN